MPLVFCEAVETGAFFSSLRHTSHGAQLTGIEISGREVWMSRCALLRSRDVSVVSKRVISENFALKNFIDFPSLGQDRELKKPEIRGKTFSFRGKQLTD